MHQPFMDCSFASHQRPAHKPVANSHSWRSSLDDWLPPEERADLVEEMRCASLALHDQMLVQPFAQTAKAAHWLVSSAIILGYPRLAYALRAVERAASENRTEDIGDFLLNTLREDFDRPVPANHGILNQLPA